MMPCKPGDHLHGCVQGDVRNRLHRGANVFRAGLPVSVWGIQRTLIVMQSIAAFGVWIVSELQTGGGQVSRQVAVLSCGALRCEFLKSIINDP